MRGLNSPLKANLRVYTTELQLNVNAIAIISNKILIISKDAVHVFAFAIKLLRAMNNIYHT